MQKQKETVKANVKAYHPELRLSLVRDALSWLRMARKALREAQAPKAAAYVARAIKSVEGAERHAENAPYRNVRQALK